MFDRSDIAECPLWHSASVFFVILFFYFDTFIICRIVVKGKLFGKGFPRIQIYNSNSNHYIYLYSYLLVVWSDDGKDTCVIHYKNGI